MKVRPLGDRVLIVKDDNGGEAKSPGGIILTDSVATHWTGKVESVGTGLFTNTGDRIPMTVKPGDTVFMLPHTGQEIKIENETYIVCREHDLVMVSSDD